jgi:fructose-1,6-bisphosphatase II / sedoheptulose-1,7-bisphosphatase
VAQVAEQPAVETQAEGRRSCLCELYARGSERAALAAARWLGRGDQVGAEEAAISGMQQALSELPVSGRVVLGSGELESELVARWR